MNSKTSTASTPSKAAVAPLTPPTLKLSTAALAQNGNINASLAKTGIFSATSPTGGQITAYFLSAKTASNFPQAAAKSGSSIPFKLLATDLTTLGDGPVTAYVYFATTKSYSEFATLSFVLDTVAPSAPALTSVKALAGLAAAQSGVVNLKGSAGDSFASTFTGATGQTVTITSRASGNTDLLGLTSAQIQKLGPGKVTVTTKATDAAGNISPASTTSFDLDTVAPSAPIVALANNISAAKVTLQQAAGGAITVRGSGGDTITTTFTNPLGVAVKVSVSSDGNAKAVTLTNEQLVTLGGGLINVATIETDPAGNNSPASTPITFTLEGKTATPTPPSTQTVARIDFYDTATNLYDGMQFNFRMMEGALNTAKDKVEIYALWDQATSGSYATEGGKQPKWSTVGTALLAPSKTSSDPVVRPGVYRDSRVSDQGTIYTKFEITSEQDTGDVNSLKNFLTKASTQGNSSTSSRTLILSNHGGGILSGFNFDGPADDATPASGASISGVQLSSLLSQSSGVPKYDMVGFDECMMGSVELAFGLKNVTKYLLASEQVVGGNGFDYFKTLANTTTSLDPVELGKKFVDSFRAGYGSTPKIGEANTLSLTDLSKMSDVATKLKSFVANMVTIQSPDFWSSASAALLRGTYYEFSYYQDLAGFVGRIAQIPSAPTALVKAAGDVLNSLGAAVLNNTVQSGGINLIPASGMNPVEQGSYGLSVVLPYNADSYSALTGGSGMRSFIDSNYRNVANDFLQATDWDKLLIALESNNCYKAGRTRVSRSSSLSSASSTTGPIYTDSTKLDFYLGFSDYADNSTGKPLQNSVSHPLGFLNGNSTDSSAKIKLGNVSFELGIDSPSNARLTIELWDTSTNKTVATLKTTANKNVVFNPAKILPKLSNTLVSPTMAIRVQTNDAEGIGFSTIVHLNGNKMRLPSTGFSADAPLKLSTTDTYLSAQILDDSHPDRWYTFKTDRIASPIAIETLPISEEDFTMEVIKNPGTSQETSVSRTGGFFMGEYFRPEPSTEYAVHVSKPDKSDGKSIDFELRVEPQIDPSEWLEFSPDVLSLSQKFEDQGKISVKQPESTQATLTVNFFSDEASEGSVFSAIGGTQATSITFTEIMSTHAPKSLTRAAVQDLDDQSSAKDLLNILKQSAGASIGTGAAKAVDISSLGSLFTIQDKPSTTSSKVYQSTDSDVIPGVYFDDVYVGFGNGEQISIDSGVYKLPTTTGSHSINFTVANGNPRPKATSGQTDSLFFYQVDSVSGDLHEGTKWIHPGDPDYAATALGRSISKVWGAVVMPFSGVDTKLNLEGEHIAMGIVANGTPQDFLDKNRNNSTTTTFDMKPNAFFSVAGANPDGLSHMISLGNSCYSFEDVVGGGKNDFTGLMVRFDGASLG